jgi:Flp pilus assembly protein TadB
MGLGTGALAGAGIGAAAYGAYSWGKEAVTAQEERSEIVQRARLGGVDYNVLQALSSMPRLTGSIRDGNSRSTKLLDGKTSRKAGRQLHQQHL